MSGADQQRGAEQENDQPSLSQVGKLLLYDELLIRWSEKDPSRVPLFRKVYGCVGRLEAETGWEMKVLLQRLGCDTEEEDFDEELTPRRLAICTEYMEWVEELLEGFDLEYDKRLVLSGASTFYKAADENLRLAKEIMAEHDEPARYLSLGETAQAWKAAARCLPGDARAGARARQLHESNPFVDGRTPHISFRRMEMLRSERAGKLLGEGVAARMRDHIDGCPQCGRAWAGLEADPVAGSVSALR